MAEPVFVETTDAVANLAAELALEKAIAVDTEADSFFHYFDKLCLVQIATRGEVFLVDPLQLPPDGLAPLAPVFANPSIRKIFHAAEYDLFVLGRHGGIRVAGLFDTMISAQLLGYPGVGLGALVERHFGIRISKDQQRTDWSRRPLKDAQVEYAAADVLYLLELAQLVEAELRKAERLEWASEEFRALESRTWPEREFDEQGYLKIKGANRLSPRELAVLRELYLMRDRRARSLDRPPFKVLGNGTLLELAQNPSSSRRTLAKRKGITDLVLRRMGQEISDAIERGTSGPEHPAPERKANGSGRRRLDRRGDVRLEHLKRWRATRSRELGLDPGVFCPNTVLEAIAWADPSDVAGLAELDAVKGWWARAFGPEVVTLVTRANQAATAPEPAPAAPGGSQRKRPRRRRGGRRSAARRAKA
jgi:ribonuclease D